MNWLHLLDSTPVAPATYNAAASACFAECHAGHCRDGGYCVAARIYPGDGTGWWHDAYLVPAHARRANQKEASMNKTEQMTEQACYELGYNSPAVHHREYTWKHVVQLNAYHAGQMDRQNQQPRNRNYDRSHYDAVSGERIAFGEEAGSKEE